MHPPYAGVSQPLSGSLAEGLVRTGSNAGSKLSETEKRSDALGARS